jgi:hypothetical protein
VAVQGVLSLQHFPGPPNFADVRKGDADETAFILTLAEPICLDDGADGFADPREPVRSVQLVPEAPVPAAAMKALLGRSVKAEGQGFAAHTGHHHAPLVVTVTKPPKAD